MQLSKLALLVWGPKSDGFSGIFGVGSSFRVEEISQKGVQMCDPPLTALTVKYHFLFGYDFLFSDDLFLGGVDPFLKRDILGSSLWFEVEIMPVFWLELMIWLMVQKSCVHLLSLVVYLIFYRVFIHPRWFSRRISEPSTVTEHSLAVDGRNPAPVEVGSLSHYLQGSIYLRWLAGFLNHQPCQQLKAHSSSVPASRRHSAEVALAHLLEQGALLPTLWVDVKARCFSLKPLFGKNFEGY